MEGKGKCSTDTTLDSMPDLSDDHMSTCGCSPCMENRTANDGPAHDREAGRKLSDSENEQDSIDKEFNLSIPGPIQSIIVPDNQSTIDLLGTSFPSGQQILDESTLAALLVASGSDIETDSQAPSEIMSQEY